MMDARTLLAAALGVEQVSEAAPAAAAELFSSTDAQLEALGLPGEQLARVRAIVELAREANRPMERGEVFRDAGSIFRHFHARLRVLRQEQFLAVLLDGKHRFIRDVLVSQGTLTSSPVHPRETFREAIIAGAAYCSNVCRFRKRRTDALGRACAAELKARVRAAFAGELWRLRDQLSRDRAARVLRAAMGQCIGCGDPLPLAVEE